MDAKTHANVIDEDVRSPSDSPGDEYGNTGFDQRDMHRMGKKQELRRGFEFFSIVGFVSILQATWESSLLANFIGLENGGTAGVIWLTIVSWICFMAMIASMAEMASMAPTAGGQYHWVSEFAPRNWEKPLSYIVGWCCCLGWIAGIPSCAQICAELVQGMVLLVHPESTIADLWKTTLIIFAFLVITFLFNIYAAEYLPLAEGVILILHVVGFLAFLILMWSVTEHVPAKKVFTEFNDGGGWGNIGLSTLVGFGSPLWFFIGPDAGAHMSEELKDASITLPRAMVLATFFNGILGIVILITFCFCVPDVPAILDTGTDEPIIQVIYNITGSVAAACVMGSLLVVLQLFGTITNIAAASRQCWAFARDRGFPFSGWIKQVRKELPLNAIFVCALVSFILAAINFGSEVAFGAIISISNATLVFSYIISIGCIRLKRWRGEKLLNCRWSLGWMGAPLNDISLAFLTLGFAFSFFPATPLAGDPTWAADMNWACIMFFAACLFAGVYYWTLGRNIYVPPVRLVKTQ